MTYRELAEYISWLKDEQMDSVVTIQIPQTLSSYDLSCSGKIEYNPKTQIPIILAVDDSLYP